jgi:hypothetical protein
VIVETLFQSSATIAALIAAFLSMRAIEVPSVTYDGPSISDVPELYVLNNRVAIDRLTQPNRKAAYFAIAAAVLSGAMPLWFFGRCIFPFFS